VIESAADVCEEEFVDHDERMDVPLKLNLSTTHCCLLLTLSAACLCMLSCASGEAVARFAGVSTTALEEGKAIYKDIPKSYARAVCDRQDLSRNFTDPSPPASCVPDRGLEEQNLEIAQQERDGLLEVSKDLTDYFDALQQLASFGTSSNSNKKESADSSAKNNKSGPNSATAGAAKSKAEAAAQKAKFDSGEVSAMGKLAELVATAFFSARLNRQLQRDIREMDPHVEKVTEALQRIVSTDYERLLAAEGKALHDRYDDAVRNQTSPAIRLLVYNDWKHDIGKVDEQKAAAEAFASALKQIRAGHNKLAEAPGQLTAKSLGSALQPYISQLALLIPQIEKGL